MSKKTALSQQIAVMNSNIFAAIPTDLSQEVFEDILVSDKLRIERIISPGNEQTGDASREVFWYDQDQPEWVLVLQGQAQLEFVDQPPVTLSCGDYLNIPAHQRHRVAWTDPEQVTIWLAIFY